MPHEPTTVLLCTVRYVEVVGWFVGAVSDAVISCVLHDGNIIDAIIIVLKLYNEEYSYP